MKKKKLNEDQIEKLLYAMDYVIDVKNDVEENNNGKRLWKKLDNVISLLNIIINDN